MDLEASLFSKRELHHCNCDDLIHLILFWAKDTYTSKRSEVHGSCEPIKRFGEHETLN